MAEYYYDMADIPLYQMTVQELRGFYASILTNTAAFWALVWYVFCDKWGDVGGPNQVWLCGVLHNCTRGLGLLP